MALPPLSPPAVDIMQSFGNELQMEATMHVSGFAMASCQASYGFIKMMPSASSAPDLKALDIMDAASSPPGVAGAAAGAAKMILSQQPSPTQTLAACLATPVEAAELGSMISGIEEELMRNALSSGGQTTNLLR